MPGFQKPIYDFGSVVKDAYKLGMSLPALVSAALGGRIDGPFREKILLAVTGFNRCRYCAFVHSHWAQRLGVDPEQIKALLNEQLGDLFGDEELIALSYARHFAEMRGEPEQLRTDQLLAAFGEKKAADITAFLRMIFFANLSGNTFDAFLARLKGEKAIMSNLLFELFFFQVSAPILLPVLAIMTLRKLLPDDIGLLDAIPA